MFKLKEVINKIVKLSKIFIWYFVLTNMLVKYYGVKMIKYSMCFWKVMSLIGERDING